MDTGDFEERRKQKALEEFSNQCQQAGQIFKQKNEEYGNAIDAGGVTGAVVELIGAVARLMVMVLHSPDAGRSKKEQIRDKLLDLHNYANIAMIMLEHDNWQGEIDWFDKEIDKWRQKS